MNRWRVGTLSMGIILVASGVLMLASLVTRINVLNAILTLWPVILICLGIEILLHLFFRKGGDAEIRIRYDALSIIFIGAMLFVSVCVYATTSFIGLFDSKSDMFAYFGVRDEQVYSENSAELDADVLTVSGGFQEVVVVASPDSKIKVDYYISLETSDKAYAESIMDKLVKLETGSSAYLLTNSNMFTGRKLGWPRIKCVIHLPENKTVDMTNYGGNFECDQSVEKQVLRAA